LMKKRDKIKQAFIKPDEPPTGEPSVCADPAHTQVITKQQKKASVVNRIGMLWTLLSTVYAIFSTCVFIARGWVPHTVTYVLIGVLCAYVIAFIVLCVLSFKDPKSGKKHTKTYKKTLKIFKAIVNIVFLALTALSMVGMTMTGMNVVKIIVFSLTFLVAAIQLGLSIARLLLRLTQLHIAKVYTVKVERFVDGRRKRKAVGDKLKENKYKD